MNAPKALSSSPSPSHSPALLVVLGVPGTGADDLARRLRDHLPADQWQVLNPSDITDLPRLAPKLVLLMGLDSARATPAEQLADTALRICLQAIHPSYAVVYGQGAQQLRAALRVLFPQEGPAPRWRGVCENCADPECEFRLFTALKSLKAAGPAPA